MSLYDTGVRPAIDKFLLDKSKEKRDYGKYWSASSAGYCQRRNIFTRLQIPEVEEDARKHRVFAVGHIFHEFIQNITKEAGLSIASEETLQDEDLLVRGHYDDIIEIDGKPILYDYKSASSRSFTYKSEDKVGDYHKMQVGTYLYMLNKSKEFGLIKEGRLLHISKDDLRQMEQQVLWTKELALEVLDYWKSMNAAWVNFKEFGKLPPCTCDKHDGGFLAKPAYNPWYYDGEPCSATWMKRKLKEMRDADKQTDTA